VPVLERAWGFDSLRPHPPPRGVPTEQAAGSGGAWPGKPIHLPSMEAAAARPGYELWRPNREKPESKSARALVVLVLLVSAALMVVVTVGGWERLEGGQPFCIGYILVYLLFAFYVARWNRGVLPVAAALAIILAIFAAIATPAWFARDKPGLDSPALPEELIGVLTLVMVPVQLILIAVAMVAFNQDWHVEEERPIGEEIPE
jgi:hypothetical protein